MSLTWLLACRLRLPLLQAAYSGSMSKGREQELARLCSEVVAATDLADARVKVRVCICMGGAWVGVYLYKADTRLQLFGPLGACTVFW